MALIKRRRCYKMWCRENVVFFVLVLTLCVVWFPVINAQQYIIQAELQSDRPGNKVYGNLYGEASVAVAPSQDGCGQSVVAIGSLYADGIPFSNGSARLSAGEAFFYHPSQENGWDLVQPPYLGSSQENEAGLAMAGGDEWLFVTEPGTPLDVNDPGGKNFAGNINAFRYNQETGQYDLHQRIPNPLGSGQDQFEVEFGASLSYWNGWLASAPGVGSVGWIHSFDEATQQWVPHTNVTTQLGPMFTAIGGGYAFFSVPFDPPQNSQAVIYKLQHNRWSYLQTIQGFWNTGLNQSIFGDLFGSPMSVSNNGWATIGASGDGATGQLYPGLESPSGGAEYFAQLGSNGLWTVTQKVVSDQPTIFYGMGNCMDPQGKNAFVADMGRTVSGNQFQGALRHFERQGSTWIQKELLFDPHGRAYDFFSICSMTDDLLVGGSFRAAAEFVPYNSYFTGPPEPGRAIIWSKTGSQNERRFFRRSAQHRYQAIMSSLALN
jgi:hypothetical protein